MTGKDDWPASSHNLFAPPAQPAASIAADTPPQPLTISRLNWRHLSAAVAPERKRMGLTQDDLARLAGVTRKVVSAIETGQHSMRLGSLLKVLRVVGLLDE